MTLKQVDYGIDRENRIIIVREIYKDNKYIFKKLNKGMVGYIIDGSGEEINFSSEEDKEEFNMKFIKELIPKLENFK